MYQKSHSTFSVLAHYGISNRAALVASFGILSILFAIGMGFTVGLGSGEWQMVMGGIFGIISAIVIVQYPFIGLALTTAVTMAITEIPAIPGLSSASVLLGGLTFAAYFLKQRWDSKYHHPRLVQMHPVLLLAILFIVWIFLSNPAGALGWTSRRNWLFTFAQLFILMWLTGRVLITPLHHKIFMGIFAVVAVVSANLVIQNSLLGLGTGTEQLNQVRTGGLGGGANQSARYFTVAFLFLYYIRSSKNRVISLLALGGMAITGIGVFATLSRTGSAIFVVAFALILLSEGFITRRYKTLAVILVFLGIFVALLPSEFTAGIESRNEDTEEDPRWGLWRAGLDMFAEYPLTGIGIGQYRQNIEYYGSLYIDDQKYLGIDSHNMYIQVLSETGIPGITLFLGMLGAAFYSYYQTIRHGTMEERAIAIVWALALLTLALGGLTKHDQYDKLLWTTLGASLCFTYNYQPKEEEEATSFVFERQRSLPPPDDGEDDDIIGRYPLPKYD